MSKKYRLPIIIIAILLVLSLTISTSYGLYKLVNQEKDYTISYVDCLEIISAKEIFTVEKLPILKDDDGKSIDPYTIAITNTCATTQEIELRFNILEGSNVQNKELKLFLNGDVKLPPTIYSSLISSANNKKNGNLASKIIGTITIDSNATKRINIRTWIDETRSSEENQNLNAKLELSLAKTVIKPIFKETLLKDNEYFLNSAPTIDFNQLGNIDPVFTTLQDDDGTSYYFRGPVTNNYVYFANKTWRIIRINGDGSVRLILESNTYDTIAFNEAKTTGTNLGYTFENESTTQDSLVKEYLDTWYETHLAEYDAYITEGRFCNDTSLLDSYGTNLYGAYTRLNENVKPTLTCPKSETNYGGEYTSKIGLITADEVALAGAVKNYNNLEYFLNINQSFYTMSPSRFAYGTAYINIVNYYGALKEATPDQQLAIRPVINLNSLVSVTGIGSAISPYTIDKFES